MVKMIVIVVSFLQTIVPGNCDRDKKSLSHTRNGPLWSLKVAINHSTWSIIVTALRNRVILYDVHVRSIANVRQNDSSTFNIDVISDSKVRNHSRLPCCRMLEYAKLQI